MTVKREGEMIPLGVSPSLSFTGVLACFYGQLKRNPFFRFSDTPTLRHVYVHIKVHVHIQVQVTGFVCHWYYVLCCGVSTAMLAARLP